ncbi:Cracr2a [Columba guinea]|nr:Cracr2a [Columba guinea]
MGRRTRAAPASVQGSYRAFAWTPAESDGRFYQLKVAPFSSFRSEFVSKWDSSIPKYSCAEIVTMDIIQGDCVSPAVPGHTERSKTGEEDPGLTVVGKAHEFFQICDLEGKGFITRQDMQRLHPQLPLSLEELEKVFVTLDADGNGSLTPKEFTTGFSQFLLGQIALDNEVMQQSEGETACSLKCKETVSDDEDEEFQFSNLMDRLGAKKILDDESDVKQLWLQLRKNEPHLLSDFEELLVRIFSQLQEADNEKNEMECTLKKKIAAYDEEIQLLYEEMEQQIKKEKEQFLLKNVGRFQSYSQELECKLLSKEQELEQLVQKQERLEQQCTELHSGKEKTKVENTKLKLTNQELLRDLERTSHELSLAQQQLQVLQEEASRLHEEKEMEVYRVTEALQREKSGLLKQLDFLRERNKHLKDERDIFLQKCKTSVTKSIWKQRSGSVIGKYIEDKMLPNRYQSITKQFFRKADGVIVMYDITAKDTFTAVKQWLISIEHWEELWISDDSVMITEHHYQFDNQEANGENVPVLLLGNKTDNEKEREVPMGMGEHLAKDYNLIFYECSAYSGYNTKKSVLHLARILKEHEDKVKEKTIELQSDMNKKSCCIRP